MKELEGRTGEPFLMRVEAGKCREFASAVAPAGIPTSGALSVAPATFLASARFWCAAEHSAWAGVERDYRRVLHGSQEFTYLAGPPRPGTELVGVESIDRVYEKTGTRGTMVLTETVTRFRETSGTEDVATTTATSITLEQPASGGRDDRPVPARTTPPGHVLVDELVDQPLSITRFVRYQGASGDFNPVHHDDAFAVAGGYPGPIAIGMLAAGVAASVVARHAEPARLTRFSARWQAPAWPGDELRYRLYRHGTDGTFLVEVTRQTGQVHVLATAEHRLGAPR